MTSQLMQVIAAQEDRFIQLNHANGDLLDFKQECIFARQQITKNRFTEKIANSNQASLAAAIWNVSAIGISLNPANQHAYLVPRDGGICLDISFKGLVKLATDSGSIKWAKAELVYKNDKFTWKGPAEAPAHEADVFSDRGEIVGGYCLARLSDGDYLVDIMNVGEINKVRGTSKAYAKSSGPWVNWYEEMAKKTLVKRASKSWPQSNNDRLNKAIEVVNEHEGTAYSLEEHAKFSELIHKKDAVGLTVMLSGLDEDTQTALFNSFEKGKISSGKQAVRDLQAQASNIIEEWGADYLSCLDSGDEEGAKQMLDCDPILAGMIKRAAGVKDE